MNNRDENFNQNSDEISVKEILLKVKEYLRFFWSKKLFFIIPFIFIVSYFVYKAKSTPVTYTGETKFFLEGDGNTNMGGIGGILGQIGVGGKKTNPYRIIEVAESKIQITNILFEKIGQDSVFIANKILDIYDLPAKWSKENADYINFYFKHDSLSIFTKLENKVLQKLIRRTIDNYEENALLTTSIEDDRGYYSIKVKTLDNDLTLFISEISYNKLKQYFEDKTRENLKITRSLLQAKSDSIKSLLNTKISQMASFKDRNKYAINNKDQIQEIVLEGEISGLSGVYFESLKSYELADYKYLDQDNYFMLIDKPMPPLGLTFPNWKIEAIKGGLLSILLSFGFLFILKLYRDIMDT